CILCACRCLSVVCAFSFYASAAHRDLHSFPTRRSSDLLPVPCRRGDSKSPEVKRRRWMLRCRTGSARPRRISRSCTKPKRERCADRKSTRLNSSHVKISYAVFCLKKKKRTKREQRRGEQ